ncbi:hypothetical protein [Niabella drilacis]|uniref:Uncharacterized protein n=1 Tax=Niabella drilacis (strain DSM 25811 / CCM 8410 / CCUG 62505 / LMG 26954 / E90) TaxID=1285928 RepID=A0A1G6ZYU5_NIADE|nr:hypothetical protein [Niabella drilacis]SDE07427.1 hypothetical protein SAMN04487894_1207 [Niabella drilacis]
MKTRFSLFILGLFIVFTGSAQDNCAVVTGVDFVSTGTSNQYYIDVHYTSPQNQRALGVEVFCGTTSLGTECIDGIVQNASETIKRLALIANCTTNLKVVITRYKSEHCGTGAICGTGTFTPGSLPVTFEKITAIKGDNQIRINWKTASENNSKEFVVEGSRDNVNWTVIGKLDSKAVDGTSSEPLDYSLSIGLPVAMAALGMGGVFLLTLVRSRWARALALVVIVLAAGACLKDGQAVDVEKGAVGYVRIAQYDKDSNTPHYSKVIKVVND